MSQDTFPKLTDVLLAGAFIPKEQFDAFNDWLESRGEPRITSFVTREEYNRRAALSATQPAQAAQGAGEVVAVVHSRWNDDEGIMLAKRLVDDLPVGTKLIRATPPTQPAPVVPDAHIAEAVKEAVAAIYFADSSDYKPALWSVVKALAPDLADLLETNESAAYHQADERARLTATPTPPAQAAQQGEKA